MVFRQSAKLTGLSAALDDGYRVIETAVTGGVGEATRGLAEELRDQTFRGLGQRMAYTWASDVFPRNGASAEAAGLVWSKAPKIISFHSAAKVHTPLGEAFAIPTGAVPRKRGGLRMTPFEVELRYNTDLDLRPFGNGKLGLFLDLVRGKSTRRPGFRAPTKGRTAQGRRAEPVLMFVLRRSITSRKLIDLEGSAERWGGRLPALIEKRIPA